MYVLEISIQKRWQRKKDRCEQPDSNQIVGIHPCPEIRHILQVMMNARSLIMKVERDELVEEVMKDYVSKHGWD